MVEHFNHHQLEQQLNIQFVTPDLEGVKRFSDQIGQLARILNIPDFELILPEKGFLANPLSPEQDKVIDAYLGPQYAKAGVDLQDSLRVIEIKETHEKMVSLPQLFNDSDTPLSLSAVPFHDACGQWAGKQRVFWVRENVARRILQAGQAIESLGYQLHIEDAFRPIGVQEGLFLRRVKLILKEHPEWINDWNKVWMEARSKTAVSPWMAGHKSGAAVDITVRTLAGEPLPLGNKYPEGGPKVALDYPYVTQKEWNTRQIFTALMKMVGLRVYPYENWHASFGDPTAGLIGSGTDVKFDYYAVYGPIKNFDQESGEVEPYQIEEYFHPFFSQAELIQSLI
jgi:D-alanyl-D-alanine dipeptidase